MGGEKHREAVTNEDDVFVISHEFETVEEGYVAFCRDEFASGAVVCTKVSVAAGYNATDEGAVVRIVEEPDDLYGDWARVASVDTDTAAIGGTNENIGFVDGERAFCFFEGDACGGEAKFVNEAVSIFSRAGEVDDEHVVSSFSAVIRPFSLYLGKPKQIAEKWVWGTDIFAVFSRTAHRMRNEAKRPSV